MSTAAATGPKLTDSWPCGCRFSRPDDKTDWSRDASRCQAHLDDGSCRHCATDGHRHCVVCGISDGFHAVWCDL